MSDTNVRTVAGHRCVRGPSGKWLTFTPHGLFASLVGLPLGFCEKGETGVSKRGRSGETGNSLLAVKMGKITALEAEAHPAANVVLNAVGIDNDLIYYQTRVDHPYF